MHAFARVAPALMGGPLLVAVLLVPTPTFAEEATAQGAPWPELVWEALATVRHDLDLDGYGAQGLITILGIITTSIVTVIGGIFLWLGTLAMRIPETSFGRSVRTNATASLLALIVTFTLWGALAVTVGPRAVEGVEFGRLLLGVLTASLVIGAAQTFVYLATVRKSFEMTIPLTAGATFAPALLHLGLGVASGSMVAAAYLGY